MCASRRIDIKTDSDIAIVHAEQLVNRWGRSGGRIVDVSEGTALINKSEVIVTATLVCIGPEANCCSAVIDASDLRLYRTGEILRGEGRVRRHNRVTLVRVSRCSTAIVPGDLSGIVDAQRLIERRIGSVDDILKCVGRGMRSCRCRSER